MFFLDAYDELPPSALWKNLWRTNNLEQFRARSVDGVDNTEGSQQRAGGAEETEAADIRKAKDNERKCDKADLSCSQFPKVLVTVRSELLSSQQDYQSSFLSHFF